MDRMECSGGCVWHSHRMAGMMHVSWQPLLSLVAAAPLVLTLSTLALLLQTSPELQTALELQFARLAVGSLWRLACCHLLHWSWDHCLWDVLVFLSAGLLCETRWPQAFRRVVAWSAGLIPFSVLISAPDLLCYRGLSGVDSALFALAAAMILGEELQAGRRSGTAIATIAVLSQFLKIAAEVFVGHTLFVGDHSFVPVPLSHFTGALIGSAVAVLAIVRKRGCN